MVSRSNNPMYGPPTLAAVTGPIPSRNAATPNEGIQTCGQGPVRRNATP
jgi:hypothetical protein